LELNLNGSFGTLRHGIRTFPWKFHAWNICPCRQAARKITPQHGAIFLAACLERQIFHAWNFHVKVPMNTYLNVPHPFEVNARR